MVILIISIVYGIKNQSMESGEDDVKSIYLYLVLFATLMMIIGGSVSAFMAIADIVYPAPYYQSYQEFISMDPAKNGVPTETTMNEAELKEKYALLESSEKEKQVVRAKNTLIKSFGWIVIPLPIFLYFKKMMTKKELPQS